MKLPRLPVNWFNQSELVRRYWDQVLNYVESIAATVGSLFGGTGILVNNMTGEIKLDITSNRNVEHSLVTLTAGSGLTGGGDITSSRSFNVGAGTGIVVNPDNVSVSSTLAAYDLGNVPSSFTTSIVSSADAASWRSAIGAGTSSTTGTVTSVNASGGTTGLSFTGGPVFTTGILTLGGTLNVSNGGTGASSLTGYLKGNGTSAFSSVSTIPASDVSGAAALTRTNDTNVTLTLGGSPSTSVLSATSLTLGWTGTLSVSRGGTGASTLTANSVLKGNGTSAISVGIITDNGSTVTWSGGTFVGGTPSSYAFQLGNGNLDLTAGTDSSFGYIQTWSGKKLILNSQGNNTVIGPVATTAMTQGFLEISAAGGAPTGTPSPNLGHVPLYYDATNNRLYVYNGGWKSVVLS